MSGLNIMQLQEIVVERLHREALVKQRNFKEEQLRNPRVNWWKNIMLSSLSLILYYVFYILAVGIVMCVGIKMTDDVFKAEKWYWQVLSFFLGYAICVLDICLFFAIPMTIMDDRNYKYEK